MGAYCMNINQIEEIFKNSGLIKNNFYFTRYIKLMKIYFEKNLIHKAKNGEMERHHILPKQIWPDFRKVKTNIVCLPCKAHYIAHYLLFKSISHSSCVYAFNQMRRVSKKYGKPNCRLYAQVRIEFAELISNNNKGAVRTESQKQSISLSNKGRNTYKNIETGELIRFEIGTEPDGWSPFQIGRKKAKSSKLKLSEKIKGRFFQFCPVTHEVRFERTLLDGFIAGYPDWFKNDKSYITESIWITNNTTKETKRIHKDEAIPEGFIKGREYINKGFEKINNKNLTRVVDLIEKKFIMLPKSHLPNPRYIMHGASLDAVFLYKYKDVLYYTYNELMKATPELPKTEGMRNKNLINCVVPKPHFNQTIERQNFCKKFQGKTLGELGIEVISLAEFNYKES